MKIILVLVILVCCFSSCYYDKAELVYPAAAACDSTNSKYSTTVVPILNSNCYSCHSGSATSGGGIKLDTYVNLKVYVTNGQLLSSILQNGTVPAMPQGAGKLSDCNINKIAAWINNGSINN